MAELYSATTVAVAVPPSDALPQAMLEAMACQVPNVLSRLDAGIDYSIALKSLVKLTCLVDSK
jgi:hypothetical protein